MKNQDMLGFSPLDGLTSSELDGHIFVTDFEDGDLIKFTKEVVFAEQNPEVEAIVIWVSSYGGNAHNVLAMIDILSSIEKPVYTVALGKAMSAGGLLVASGRKGMRFCLPNSYMMIHEVIGGAGGKTQDVIQQVTELNDLNKQIMSLLSKYTGKKISVLRKILEKRHNTDLVLSAKQSKDFGLIDFIGVPKIVKSRPQTILAVMNPDGKVKA